jgi:dienelactone hydrolase
VLLPLLLLFADGPFDALARESFARHREEVAALSTPAEVRARQEHVRAAILRSLGGLPSVKTPLNPRITGGFTRDGYRVEKMIFESQPRFYVTANVYVPAGRGPFPAVLGVAGHSNTGKAVAIYQRAWIGMAKRGILVLAFDPPGQGERQEYFDPDYGRSLVGVGTSEHIMAGTQCFLAGSNVARYEVWDGIRAVDYLLTRPDVDGKRLGVAGNSGGGTQSAYLMALESRLAAAAPSCYLTSWEDLWTAPGPQDAEQNFAGFLSAGLDFSDFLLAFAPRPVKMHAAIRDFFPIAGARKAFAEAGRAYRILDVPDRVGFFEFDDTHGWSQPRRESTYAWFDQHLLGKPAATSAPEPAFNTEHDRDLEATTTGQVKTSLGGETVQSLNAREAAAKFARRSALRATTREQLAQIVDRRIVVKRVSEGQLPAVWVGLENEGRRPAILYLRPSWQNKPDDEMNAMSAAGYVVVSPQLTGWPEDGSTRGYNPQWQNAMRAMLLGRTVTGLQTAEALDVLRALKQHPRVNAARVSIIGRGHGGVIALHTALFEPVERVAMEGTIVSFMDIIRARVHEGVASLIVPGVIEDYDLPDLAKFVKPIAIEPRAPAGGRLTSGRPRREGAPWAEVYREWQKPSPA